MFVELGRAEAQRLLDEMKRDLTMKPYVPHSHKSSTISNSSSPSSHYFQNRGVFDHHQSPYPCRLLLQEPYGGHSSSSFPYDSREKYDVMESFRGYEGNESYRRRLQPPSLGSFDDGYRSYYSAGDSYNHSGARSRQLSHGVTVDPIQSNIGVPYARTSSSLYDNYHDRLAEGSAERHYNLPATWHSPYQPTPFAHGGSYILGAPNRSFLNDVQHGRTYLDHSGPTIGHATSMQKFVYPSSASSRSTSPAFHAYIPL